MKESEKRMIGVCVAIFVFGMGTGFLIFNHEIAGVVTLVGGMGLLILSLIFPLKSY